MHLLLLALMGSPTLAAPTEFPTDGPIRFLVFGDSGTGTDKQYAVARAMDQVCKERTCQFAIVAGDNIYEDGPASAEDPQFETKFEKPFAAFQFPFLMALGNHDVRKPEGAKAEIAYTKKSKRWMMPSRFYSFAAPVLASSDFRKARANPIVEFFVIDTNTPKDQEQAAWLRKSIGLSEASFKFVVGHHPYRSNGYHGNAGEELSQLYEKEVCEKTDVILTGHDHGLGWLSARAACGSRPQFIISGAAAKTGDPGNASEHNPAVFEAYKTLGFFWMEATAEKLKIAAYTVDNEGKPKLAHEGQINTVRTQGAGTQSRR